MTAIYHVSQVFGLLSFCALIWLVVRAFKRSVLWGLAVLFLSPISATVFGIKYWYEERKPFLAYVGTFIPAFALGMYVFTAWGGWDIARESLSLHEGTQSGTLSEEQALAFMRSNLRFMDNAIDDPHGQRKLDVMNKFLDKLESGMSEEDMRELNTEMLDLIEQEDLSTEELRQLQNMRRQLLSTYGASGEYPEAEPAKKEPQRPSPRYR